MRKLFALLLLTVAPLAAVAQDKKNEKKEPAKKLSVGDPAPKLVGVDAWLNGDEVKEFDAKNVYVLEFWATWCGPCIAAMPHLSDLADEYKKQGLVVIGVTTKDDSNTRKKVEEFAAKNKTKARYVLAYCDKDDTNTAFMDAADQKGIPCSFVIGKDGKIAYIGHPMNLDDVLPKVLDGTWKGKADVDAMEAREKALDEVFAVEKPEGKLEKLAAFEKKYADYAKKDEVRMMRMRLLMDLKKWDDAKVIADEFIATSDKKKKSTPAMFAVEFANRDLNPDKKHLDVGVKALETALKYDDKDLRLLVTAVEVYMVTGDKVKAAAFGKKAVEAAPDDDVKKQVQKVVDEIQKDKK